MTLADALEAAATDPAPATMGRLFEALVAAPDEAYVEFWHQLGSAPFRAGLRRRIEQARGKTDHARSLLKASAARRA